MSRVLDWLRETLHHSRAETTHHDDEEDTTKNISRQQQDEDNAQRALDNYARDTRVDQRIYALEQLAEQLRRRRERSP